MTSLLIQLIGVVVLVSLMMLLDILLVWVERKVVARFQDRLGPNRVGPFGLIQPFADIIKLLDQGRHHAGRRGPGGLQPGADPVPDVRAASVGDRAACSRHPRRRSERRRALHHCGRCNRYAVHHHGRLVLEQQVRADRRLPPGGRAGFLRSADDRDHAHPNHPGRFDGHECHHPGAEYLVRPAGAAGCASSS